MRNQSLIAVATVLIFICVPPARGQGNPTDPHPEFSSFVTHIADILNGKTGEVVEACISPSARFVVSGKEVLLSSVLHRADGAPSLADPAYQGIAIWAQTNDADDAGFLVFKTRSTADSTKVRYHSVYFLRDSTGRYRVNLWHADGIPR